MQETSKYSWKEDVHHIEGGEDQEQNSIVDISNETSKIQYEIFSGHDCCAVCGKPSSKKCSKCKAVKYW